MHRHRSLPNPRSHAAMVAALALSLAAPSCAERPRREVAPPAREARPPAPAARRDGERMHGETVSASRSFLIYSVQWGKAEDLALTIEPIIQARYGPAARVVPHVPTNKLFIYLPSPREQEAAGATRGVSSPQGVPGAQGVPSAGRRASTGGRTR